MVHSFEDISLKHSLFANWLNSLRAFYDVAILPHQSRDYKKAIKVKNKKKDINPLIWALLLEKVR